MRRPDRDEVMHLAEGVRTLRRRARVRQPPAGDAVGRGETVNGHRPIAHAVEGGDAQMLAAVDEMLIDLVRDRQRVELLAETGDERQLVPGVDLPGRVVWSVDDDRPGAGIEGPAQLVAVKVPIRWHQRYHHRR